jgi:hypothetical protein
MRLVIPLQWVNIRARRAEFAWPAAEENSLDDEE